MQGAAAASRARRDIVPAVSCSVQRHPILWLFRDVLRKYCIGTSWDEIEEPFSRCRVSLNVAALSEIVQCQACGFEREIKPWGRRDITGVNEAREGGIEGERRRIGGTGKIKLITINHDVTWPSRMRLSRRRHERDRIRSSRQALAGQGKIGGLEAGSGRVGGLRRNLGDSGEDSGLRQALTRSEGLVRLW